MTNSSPKKKNNIKRIEGLDSLRFLAFLMVFLFHTSDYFFFGFLGVDFFFVLSSFLLTYLAFKEWERTNKFSRVNFFMRRVLRIFPLYYLIVLLGFVVIPTIGRLFNISISLPEKPFLFLIFLSNYDTSNYLLPLEFLWSISVEEQFYLLFLPLTLFIRKNLWWIIIGLLAVYFLYYYIDQYYHWDHYRSVFFHFPNFALGMLGGFIFFRKWLETKVIIVLFIATSLILFTIPVSTSIFNIILSVWFMFLIFFTANLAGFLSRYKVFKATEFLGKYTYGLYVYSGFVIVFFNKFIEINNLVFRVLSELTATFLIAYLSYHLFERHFLKFKNKFRFARIRN